eukprot:gnl/Spiro4/11094_TR5882_c0_g1_i1.p1 gnl/Spiro4/11094_TR5882_c0_g1~~gnl/Spiro4/11094_TR5882_c0_g1_i1.p1  ORF type:complete len:303 (-),score=106.32 gnl/Spiro4/11094_TR5882_c0_g1_i1:68-949(-)
MLCGGRAVSRRVFAQSWVFAACFSAKPDQVTQASPKHYENILVEKRDRVGLVTLNNPKKLNALSSPLIAEVNDALHIYDKDDGVGCVIITGSGQKAFAAGANIAEMEKLTYMKSYKQGFIEEWQEISRIKKPMIAAVNGFALGGGCELAMMCDIIIASSNAMFGQPEIKLGTIPGAGGTQRLVKAIGKSKAMELCLTGMMMSAADAERFGLVSHVVPPEELLDKAFELARKIASFSLPISMMVKECVNASFETTLSQGLAVERRMFHSTFSTKDQKLGMTAFLNKQEPAWTNE